MTLYEARNRLVNNLPDNMVWRKVHSWQTSYSGPSSTTEPGNIRSNYGIIVQENIRMFHLVTGYVYNNYKGWATYWGCIQQDTVTIVKGAASATLGTDNAGGAENMYSGFAISGECTLTPATYAFRYGDWKKGGGSYAPRCYDLCWEVWIASDRS